MKQKTRVLSVLLALVMAFSLTAFAAEALTVTATYNGADLEGATVPAGSDITLAFSNNVTEESILQSNISKIKVKIKNDDGSEGDAVSATVSVSDKTTLIVTLGADLAKGSYVLTIGKDLTAKNGTTLGSKFERNFTVKGSGSGTGGGNNPLTVESVLVNGEPLEGKELEAGAQIVIQFARGMTDNAEANFEQISVLKADGTKAAFEIETNKDKSNENAKREYIITLGENEEGGAFTLVIGADVKANNGNTLGEDMKIAFTFKAAEEPAKPTFFERVKQFFVNLFAKIEAFFGPISDKVLQMIRNIFKLPVKS